MYAFPSPIGELHFSINYYKLNKPGARKGFRPLSGSYISQYNEKFDINKFLFPSPIGELHFSISSAALVVPSGRETVSVPYRGATFLNALSEIDRTFLMLQVSVPYRGATFLNTIPATPCPVWDE